MTLKSKICGISDSETLNYLTNHNYSPELIGFIVNYPKSKRFVKFENEIYIFQEKDSFGMVTYRYNKHGKIVRDGKGEEGKTKKTTTI